MKKLLLIISVMLIVGGAFFFLFRYGKTGKGAAIQINASPKAKVIINGQDMGFTPYDNEKMVSGEISFRLVPEGLENISWERGFYLNPDTKTIISRDFDADSEKEAGEIIFLEKTPSRDKAGLMVISDPNNSSVTLDSEMRGFSPLGIDDIGEGEHRLTVTLPDYKTREILAKAINGYRLVIEVKLAKEETKEATESAETQKPENAEITKPYVLIKDTPTGWLRIRIEPSTSASEAGKVNPGEKYPLIGEKSGWYEIRYGDDKEGWISGRYAEKFE